MERARELTSFHKDITSIELDVERKSTTIEAVLLPKGASETKSATKRSLTICRTIVMKNTNPITMQEIARRFIFPSVLLRISKPLCKAYKLQMAQNRMYNK